MIGDIQSGRKKIESYVPKYQPKNTTEVPEMQILGSFPQFLAPPGGEHCQKW